jgi:hypothetical protein
MNDDLERRIARDLYDLSHALGKLRPDAQTHGVLGGEWGYGQHFKNYVFEMHPFYWGECECGADDRFDEWFKASEHDADCCGSPCTCSFVERQNAAAEANPHAADCPEGWPNFRHAASGFEVCWYKWIGRGMNFSREISTDEWARIAAECMASVRVPEPS